MTSSNLINRNCRFKGLWYLALMLVSINSLAQKALVSVGGNVVVPSSFGLETVARTGLGGSIRLETSFSQHINGILTIEYLRFGEKKTTQSTANLIAIPIQAGIKYYTSIKEKIATGFFISAEAGMMPLPLNILLLTVIRLSNTRNQV